MKTFYADPSYHRSNKAFVEEWKAPIDDYGRIFSGATLAPTRAAGVPFNPARKPGASTLQIAAYFAHTPLGSNAKATQNYGVGVRHPLTLKPVQAILLEASKRFLPSH